MVDLSTGGSESHSGGGRMFARWFTTDAAFDEDSLHRDNESPNAVANLRWQLEEREGWRRCWC